MISLYRKAQSWDDAIAYMRAQQTMKSNWLQMKVQCLAYLGRDRLKQLEYRNEAQHSLLKPTIKVVKQSSYKEAVARNMSEFGVGQNVTEDHHRQP